MPPRKRTRATTASSPPSTKPDTTSSIPSPAPSADARSPTTSAEKQASLLSDPWTDAEETALFRALIKHKPTGLHKHMQMLSIYTSLLSQGYVQEGMPTPRRGSADVEGDLQMAGDAEVGREERHTSIKGIWRKLEELYDLEALDERELEGDYERVFGVEEGEDEDEDEEEESTAAVRRKGRRGREEKEDEQEDEDEDKAPIGKEFELPEDEEDEGEGRATFAHLKWSKRFPSPTPSLTGSGPPSPMTNAVTRKGRAGRPKVERRESSPAQMPELVGHRHIVPVRFEPSFSVPSDDEGAGRDTATPVRTTEKPARGRRGRPSTGRGGASAAKTKDKERESTGMRRSSRVATNTNESEEEAEEEGSGEGEDDEEEEESSSEEEQDSPEKKSRGRGAPRGRGRGPVRGRRGKK
ncbi:putative chromatin modification-related protein EAF7 [Elsinoe australis]|uniref:Putative chromatin modification-related protein EAF7 n=1 Tax=Elsinoe australis TaxID=40998 RepID=A0A4U7B9Z9_9PEZI|nr:putative chromatin modification-related protein EAF7 [Elsinoe australis]